jgi:hypothetical protein
MLRQKTRRATLDLRKTFAAVMDGPIRLTTDPEIGSSIRPRITRIARIQRLRRSALIFSNSPLGGTFSPPEGIGYPCTSVKSVVSTVVSGLTALRPLINGSRFYPGVNGERGRAGWFPYSPSDERPENRRTLADLPPTLCPRSVTSVTNSGFRIPLVAASLRTPSTAFGICVTLPLPRSAAAVRDDWFCPCLT